MSTTTFLFPTVEEIVAEIGDLLVYIFFFLIKMVFDVVDAFTNIVFKLAGFTSTNNNQTILEGFFSYTKVDGKGTTQISMLYFYVCLACVALMVIFTVFAIIKQDFFSEEAAKSHAPIFKRMVTGLLYFILIPPLFLFIVRDIISGLITALMKVESFSKVSSISQTIFELSLVKPDWLEGTGINPIPHWSVVDGRVLTALTETYNFNWLIFIGVVGISIYSLFMIAFGLVKRIVNLVVLYVLGPIAIAQSVLDGGSKMKNWKDSVIKEFVSVFGTVIGLAIFFVFVGEVVNGDALNIFSISGVSGFSRTVAILGNSVVKAMFILVGFSVVKGGAGGYIANAIGGNLSIDDGKAAFTGMKDAAKFATTPFATTGKAIKTVGQKSLGAAQGIGKAVNTFVDKDSREAFIQKHKPTLDGFRTEEQIKKRKAIEEAQLAAKRETDPAKKARLENIADPNKMQIELNTKITSYQTVTNATKAQADTAISSLKSGIVTRSGPISVTDSSEIVTARSAVSADIPASTTTYDDTAKAQYKEVKRKVDVAIKEETRLMNRSVAKEEAELQRLIATGASDADVQIQQERVISVKELYNTRIEQLTEVQQKIEKTEQQHAAIQELRNVNNDITNAGNIKDGDLGKRAAQINAATKADEKLNSTKDVFK